MIPVCLDLLPPEIVVRDDDLHVLVISRLVVPRFEISALLLETGLRVTTAATFGVADVLLRAQGSFDVLVVAESAEETATFGAAQLARSVDPDLPIVVLDSDTVRSPATVALVQAAMARWPLREPPVLRLQ